MKWLKTTSSSKFAALLVSATVLGFASQSASALTPAGTSIANTASLTYSIGGAAQTPIPSSPTGNNAQGGAGTPTSFVVDRKVDFTVTGGAVVGVQPGQPGLPVAPSTATTAMAFTVSNTGNGPQSFNLTPASVAGNTFTPGTFSMYVLPVGTPFNPAAPGTAVTKITDLAAGGSQVVYVVANIPNVNTAAAPASTTLLNGNQALVTLSVQATVPTAFATATLLAGSPEVGTVVPVGGNATGGANVATVDVVLADVAQSGVAAVTTPTVAATPAAGADAARNGVVVAVGTYKIQSAAVLISKLSSPVCDPVNGNTNPMNIPGTAIQWAITLYNPTVDANGIAVTTNATLTAVTDPLDVNTLFDPNKVAGQAAGSAGTLCSGTGSVNLATAAAGVGYTLSKTAPVAGAAPAVAAPAGSVTAAAPVAGTNGGTVTVNPALILTTATASATGTGTRTTAGDLIPGEYLTLYFNSIVQ